MDDQAQTVFNLYMSAIHANSFSHWKEFYESRVSPGEAVRPEQQGDLPKNAIQGGTEAGG